MSRVLALFCVAALLTACGQTSKDEETSGTTTTNETPYGSAADVEKYVAQIAPYVQQISQLQSQYETALASQQGDSNDRRGTGRNLANKAEEVRPELRTLQTTFDTVEPPAALAPFHRDIRKLIALRLSAYDKTIDGWADENAGGDRHKAIYGDVERAQDEANQLILALIAQMQKIQTALAAVPSETP